MVKDFPRLAAGNLQLYFLKPHPSIKPVSASVSTSRHPENPAYRHLLQIGVKDLICLTRDKRNYPDTPSFNHVCKQLRNGSANQNGYAQLKQGSRPVKRQIRLKRFIALADNHCVFDFRDKQHSRGIENRRDSIFPNGKSHFHFWIPLTSLISQFMCQNQEHWVLKKDNVDKTKSYMDFKT